MYSLTISLFRADYRRFFRSAYHRALVLLSHHASEPVLHPLVHVVLLLQPECALALVEALIKHWEMAAKRKNLPIFWRDIWERFRLFSLGLLCGCRVLPNMEPILFGGGLT